MLLSLILAACSFSEPAPAPEPEARIAAPAPAPAPALPRAVVDGETIIACQKDGQPASGADCPVGVAVDAVAIAPIQDGPIRLQVTRSLSAKDEAADICDWLVGVVRKDPPREAALGRAMTVLPSDNETYRKLVSEAVGIPGVTLTGLVRLDLEGDGTDEVLFSANSHPDGFPYGEKGLSYAFVGVRRVGTDNKAETLLLFEHRNQMSGESPMDHLSAALMGVTDLEGDGKLEVVFSDGYYEGESWHVGRVEPGKATELGSAGCGV